MKKKKKMAASSTADANDDIGLPTYEYIDINTKPFHVGTFENLWKQTLNPKYYSIRDVHQETDEEFAEEIAIPPESVEELKVICSPDTLRCHPEKQPPDTDVVPADPGLMTLRLRKRRQDHMETLVRAQTCRQDFYKAELENLAVGKMPVDLEDLLTDGELILNISVLFPAVPSDRYNHFKARQTLQVLGSHKLTDLRDAICCLSDLQVNGEFSNTPDMAPEFISKDLFKSAFLFLEGIFYNDMRYPECKDLSQTVQEWAESHNMPTFQTAKMEETTFRDLKIKIGYPYLYCHQGDCEHVVLITDIRLAHRDDCLDIKLYPLLTHKHRMISRRCAICNLYISRWITTDDSFAPTDPCLFCDICFRMLHYDPEGNKVGDFLAYPYVDPGAFN